MKKHTNFVRALAFLITLALSLSFLPILPQPAFAEENAAADVTAMLDGYKRVTLNDFEGLSADTAEAGSTYSGEIQGVYTGDSLNKTYLDFDINFNGTSTNYLHFLAEGNWTNYKRLGWMDGGLILYDPALSGAESIYVGDDLGQAADGFFNIKISIDIATNADDPASEDVTLGLWVNNTYAGTATWTESTHNRSIFYIYIGSGSVSLRTPTTETEPTVPEESEPQESTVPEATEPAISIAEALEGYERVTLNDFDGIIADETEAGTTWRGEAIGRYTGDTLNKTYLDFDINFNGTTTNYLHFFAEDIWNQYKRLAWTEDGMILWDPLNPDVGTIYAGAEHGQTADGFFNVKIRTDITQNAEDSTKEDVLLQLWINDTYVGEKCWTETAHNRNIVYFYVITGSLTVRTPAAESDPTEPEVTEPEPTEPEVTEPETTEPEATEPESPIDIALKGYTRVTMNDFDGISADTTETGTTYSGEASGTYGGTSMDKTYLDFDINFNGSSANYLHFLAEGNWANYKRLGWMDGGLILYDPANAAAGSIFVSDDLGQKVDGFFNVKILIDIVQNADTPSNDDVTLQLWVNDTYAGQATWTEAAHNRSIFYIYVGSGAVTFRTPTLSGKPADPDLATKLEGYNRVTLNEYSGIVASQAETGTTYTHYAAEATGTYTGASLNKTYLDFDVNFNGTTTNYMHLLAEANWSKYIRLAWTEDGLILFDPSNADAGSIFAGLEYGQTADGFFNVKIRMDITPNAQDSTQDDVLLLMWINDAYVGQMSFTEASHSRSVFYIYKDTNSLTLRTPQHKDVPVTDENVAFTLNGDSAGYTLSGCHIGASGVLDIPAVYNGLPVTTIGTKAFANCRLLSKIHIPDSVTRIEFSAFWQCMAVTEITLPESIEYIDGEAFFNCWKLDNVVIPSGITTIESYTFHNCYALQSVTLPDTVTDIGFGAFEYCKMLEEIALPSNLESIDKYAFQGCTALKSIKLPDSLTFINEFAFKDCESLRDIDFGKGYTTIGKNSFAECTGLINLTIPGTVTTIDTYGFKLCKNLTDVTFEYGVTTVGQYAFNHCDSLKNIHFSDSVTELKNGAFSNCPSLVHVTIPDSVTTIGSSLFSSCKRLQSVDFGTGLTSLGDSTFSSCTGLTSFVVPEHITDLGVSAFYYCTGLTDVTLHNKLTKIGEDTFIGCSSLASIEIPESITEIGRNAFSYCDSLTEVTFPDSVVLMGSGVFSKCANLTRVVIPAGIASIPGSFCAQCPNLTEVVIGDNITTIEDHAFSRCGNLKEIIIPDSVTGIEESAFEFCTSLKRAVIGDGVATIGNYAFYSCNLLESVYLGSSLQEIGDLVFSQNASLDIVLFNGTKDAWDEICFEENNANLYNANLVCYDYTGMDMLLGDDLTMRFFAQIEEYGADAYIDICIAGGDAIRFDASAFASDSDNMYIVTSEMAAAQMTDEVVITIVANQASRELCRATIRDYADAVLSDEGAAQYHDLVNAMLQYGAMAQVYFDYNADCLANSGITVNTPDLPADLESRVAVNGSVDAIRFYGATMVFRNRNAVRYYFTVNDDIAEYRFTMGDHTYTPVAKDGMYYVEIADINPQDLDKTITLTITGQNGDFTVSYCPMDYIANAYSKGSDHLKDLLKATYAYHLEAKALTA